MARITGGTVQQQACLTQQFEKEEVAALQFFIKNMDLLNSPSGVSAVLQKQLERTKIDGTRCDRLAVEAAKRAEERVKFARTKIIPTSEITSEYLAKKLDMRPASPKTKALLYEGISHDKRGRYQYLRSRYQKDPEVKFPFPLPLSWDLGWRLSDTIKRDSVKKSPFGHVSIVKNTFFTRTGVLIPEKPAPKPWYGC